MKKSLAVLCGALLIAGCATGRVDQAAVAYDRDISAWRAKMETGQISVVDYRKAVREMMQKHYPNDHDSIAFASYMVMQAERLERGEIAKADYDYLRDKAWADVIARRQTRNAEQQRADAEQVSAALEYAAGALRNSATTIRQGQPTNCRSTAYPETSTVRTTCW